VTRDARQRRVIGEPQRLGWPRPSWPPKPQGRRFESFTAHRRMPLELAGSANATQGRSWPRGNRRGNRGHSEGGTGGGRKLGCCRQGGGSHAAAARLDPNQLRMALRGHRPDGLLPREASPAKVAKNGQHHDDDNDNPKPGRHVDPSFRGGCARPYDEGTPCTTSLAASDWLDFEIGQGRQPRLNGRSL
jgi:hypothetical protein